MKIRILATAAAIVTLAAGHAHAQAQTSYKRDLPDSLVREAKVTESAAIAMAKKAVPNGEVASIELEREGGKLIYSMDVKTAGKKGIDEVNVDAKTGRMVGGVQHENPATESAEAKAEAAAAKYAAKNKA
jgi:uncharacterized membrane protein YkoI